MAIDLEAGKEVTGKHGEKVKIDKAISDVDASDFDALLIPGGFSPDLLRADDRPGEFASICRKQNLFSQFATARKY